MITKSDVDNLADLVRLELSEEEKNDLLKDLDRILEYVSELNEVKAPEEGLDGAALVVNVARADGEDVNETGVYTDKLLEEAPKRTGDYIEVKAVFKK